jgi:hypothetical protein
MEEKREASTHENDGTLKRKRHDVRKDVEKKSV